MAARRLRGLARHLASGGGVDGRDRSGPGSRSQLAVIDAAKAATVVTANQDETPAEMSDTEKFLWDLQGVSPVAALLSYLRRWWLTVETVSGSS